MVKTIKDRLESSDKDVKGNEWDDSTGKITLAVGDGANDVNMIQEANIGIGLYGKEGLRAVQASDYALGEFRFLRKLILVHGRWSYIRISELILYFFYKNIIYTFPQFIFSWYNLHSGMTIFDDWYMFMYNSVFTMGPLLVKAIVQQDVYYKVYDKNTKECDEISQIKVPTSNPLFHF